MASELVAASSLLPWVVLLLAAPCACTGKNRERHEATTLPSATSSAAAAPPYVDSTPWRHLRDRPDKIRVEYDITRDSVAEQTLWANVVDLGIRKAIAHSKAPYVCGVIAQPDLSEPLGHRSLTSAHVVCGDRKDMKWVSIHDDDVLWLGEHPIQFYRFTKVDHSDIRQPLPPPRDCAGKPPTPVSVQVRRDRKGLYLMVPELGIKYYLTNEFDSGGPWYCLSTLRKRAQRLNVECVTSPHYTSAELFLQRDVLFVQLRSGASIGDVHQDSRVGFELPCNAVPRFRGYDYLSPKYGYYDKCFDRCMIRQERCERDCNEKLSDGRGELDDEGRECVNQCQSEHQVCQRCGR